MKKALHIQGFFVRKKGLEPPRREAPDPKSGAATNYATSAVRILSWQRYTYKAYRATFLLFLFVTGFYFVYQLLEISRRKLQPASIPRKQLTINKIHLCIWQIGFQFVDMLFFKRIWLRRQE